MTKLNHAKVIVTVTDIAHIPATVTQLASLSRLSMDELDVEIRVGAPSALSPEDAAALAGVVAQSAALLAKARSISTESPQPEFEQSTPVRRAKREKPNV